VRLIGTIGAAEKDGSARKQTLVPAGVHKPELLWHGDRLSHDCARTTAQDGSHEPVSVMRGRAGHQHRSTVQITAPKIESAASGT
jgi:hypothetical protein